MPMIGNIRTGDWLAEVELDLDIAQYAAGDLMSNPVEVPNACKRNGVSIVQTVVAIDYDDQAENLDVLFFGQNPGPLGLANAPLAITDAVAGMIQGIVTVDTWLDCGAQQIGQEQPAGPVVHSEDTNGTSIWIATRSAGTGTYASGTMTLKLGLLRG